MYDIEAVLQAFRSVQRWHPAASLWIAGTGSEEARLRQLVATWELANVRFLGEMPHKELPAIYDECDVYLNASRVDNFPGALLEASAAGSGCRDHGRRRHSVRLRGSTLRAARRAGRLEGAGGRSRSGPAGSARALRRWRKRRWRSSEHSSGPRSASGCSKCTGCTAAEPQPCGCASLDKDVSALLETGLAGPSVRSGGVA